MSTDVLGRLVEVLAGRTLDEVFRKRIFEPLGMTDTGFGPGPAPRTASPRSTCRDPAGGLVRNDAAGGRRRLAGLAVRRRRAVLDAGRLPPLHPDAARPRASSATVRLLGDRTLRYMTRNHLPGGADLEAFGRPLFAETPFDGVGFGLGFSVALDPVATHTLSSPGEYDWGGAASTAFWVDPVEDITAVFMTQLLPSSTYPIRSQLRQLVYSALVD